MSQDPAANLWRGDLAQLEGEGADDVALFGLGHRAEEQARLAVVVGKGLGAGSELVAAIERGMRGEAEAGILARRVGGEAVGLVRDLALVDVHPPDTIALKVAHRTLRTIDRNLVEVRATQPQQLRVGVGEQAALQQRIVGEVDTRHHVAGMKGDLFGFGEDVVGVAVEHHATERLQRRQFLGDDLRRIENVEGKLRGKLLIEGLDGELELREVAHRDGVVKIAALRVGIGAIELDRFIPDERRRPNLRAPVELDEGRRAAGIDEAERMNAEALHHPQRSRQRAIGHRPENHVEALGHQRDEVPERVVGAGGLRVAAVRLHLHRMNQVRELDGILNEEHRDVVADQIEVAVFGVELHRKAADVTRGIA